MPAALADQDAINCATTANEPAQVFELAALVRRCMDDRAFAAVLVEKFTARLPTTIQEIEGSLAARDWATATAKAHNLKGEAGSLAASALQAAASQLEESLRGGQHDLAPSLLLRLKSAAEACVAARTAAVEQLSGSGSIFS